MSAMRIGMRYLAAAPELRGVLARLAAYVLGYSVVPALLAVLARARFHAGAAAFGLLLGSLGLGGVLGASLLPRLRARFGSDAVAVGCTLTVAAALAGLGVAPSLAFAYPTMVLLGFVSIGTISSFMIAAQAVLPAWVRGRGLAILSLVFQAGFAVGAILWGAVAVGAGITSTLIAAAGVVALGALLGLRIRLAAAEHLDVRASYVPEPYPPVTVSSDDGPVQLSVTYEIDDADLAAFTRAAARLRQARRRSGAMRWTLYTDVHNPARQVETFTVSSWAEHLRQAERETEGDRQLADHVAGFHRGSEPPWQEALISERATGRSSQQHPTAPADQ